MNTGNRLRFAVVAGTAGLLATLYAGASSIIDQGLRTAWSQAETTIERTAKAAESIVNNHFLQVDSALASLSDLVATTSQGAPLTPLTVRRILQSVNFQTFASRDIVLLRPTGELWSSVRQPLGGRPLPTAGEILKVRPAPGSHALVGPVKNPRTGDWVLYLVRVIDIPGQGSFHAAAEMPVASLTAALSPATQVEGLHVVLAYGDRTVVASIPHDELAIGTRRDGPEAKPATPSHPLAVPGRGGIEAQRATLYGDIRVNLRLPAEAALQKWQEDRTRVSWIALTGGGLLVLFAGVVLVGLYQRERLEGARKSAQQLLEDAIGRMSDGFAMWDADGRLVTSNERFRELHGSGPAASPASDPADPDRPWLGSFEQEFHGGRWYLVTQSLTSGGGIVAVLKDITERKSQERLILDHSEELARLAVRFETTVKSGASKLEASAGNASLEVDMMADAARDAVAQAKFVSSTAEGTSERVRVVAAGIEQLRAAIQEISARVDAASTVNARVAACSKVATTVMSTLDKSASEVSAVVDIISSLASQTNLLALNATIEAARAGEAGRGFAVVASEVKALATQTAQSTDAIARQVRSMQQSSIEASRTIASIASIVAELTDVSRSIELAVHEQTTAVGAISASTQQTAARTSDVSRAVAMIADRSEQINRSTEGLRDTMLKLLGEAQTLGEESQQFLASVRRA